MDSRKIKGVEHFVYDSVEEFMLYHRGKEDSIQEPVHWKSGEEGDWVVADDGGVVQILKIGKMATSKVDGRPKRSVEYVRTVVGTFIKTHILHAEAGDNHIQRDTKMDTDFSQHPNRYTISRNPGIYKTYKTRTRLSTPERLWVLSVLVGTDPVDAYIRYYKTQSRITAHKKAVMLLKQERVVRALREGIQEAANNLGLTDEWVLERLKNLAESASSDKVKREAVIDVAEIIGTKGTKTKEVDTFAGVFRGFGNDDAQKVFENINPKRLEESGAKEAE